MAGSGAFPKVAGDTIFANDYNTIYNSLAAIIGVGSGTSGYGDTITPSSVEADSSIAGSPWVTLKDEVLRARKHQIGAGTAYNTLASTFATLTTKLTTYGQIGIADINTFKTTVDTIVTNKDTAATSQLTKITGTTTSYTPSWNGAIAHTATVTFATATDARNFFNAGGYIVNELSGASPSAGGTPPNSSAKDNDWLAILSSANNTSYTASNYRSGTANVVIRSETYGSSYGDNYFKAWGERLNATTIKITMLFDDASVISGLRGQAGSGDVYDELVTLNITSAVNYYKSFDAIVSPVPSGVTATAFSPVRTDDQTAGVVPGFGTGTSGTATVTRGATNVNEGNTINFTVASTNIPSGTTLYWTVSRPEDFATSTSSFNISASGTGSFSVIPSADTTTEGAETFTVSIWSGAGGTGTRYDTSASVTINDTSTGGAGVTESISGVGATFTIGSVLTYTVNGTPNTQATYSWTGVKPDGSSYTGLATNTFTLNGSGTATASGVFLSGPGTFVFTVVFAATGSTRSATTASLINATWETLAVASLDILNAASTTGQRGARLQNNTGYGGLNYVATGPYTTTIYGVSSSGTLAANNNAPIRIANPHAAGTATVTLTQTNQAQTVLTLAIPAHITYGWAQWAAEYGADAPTVSMAQTYVDPLYRTRNEYQIEQTESSSLIKYGLYRNPDAEGVDYWTDYIIANYGLSPGPQGLNTFRQTFFAGLGGDDPPRAESPQTSFRTGTGYNIFFDRGTV
jgi:hypothetical protein